MSQQPVFAVVGHPNKGKSSVVATLSQNDAIAIARNRAPPGPDKPTRSVLMANSCTPWSTRPASSGPGEYCSGWKPTACRPPTTRKPSGRS